MIWTREVPTKPGWYWWRRSRRGNYEPIYRTRRSKWIFGGEWYTTPIEAPDE